MTKTEKNVNAILQYIYNNYKKQPFEFQRVQKWCIDFKVPAVYFFHLKSVGAIDKVGRGVYVLKDYNSNTWTKVRDLQRVPKLEKEQPHSLITPPAIDKKLIPLQVKIDESVEFLKEHGYKVLMPETKYVEI